MARVVGKFEVTVPCDVEESMRGIAAGLFDDAFRVVCRYPLTVATTDTGVELKIEVYSGDETTAKRKAQYWCQRAAKKARTFTWNDVPMSRLEARRV